MSDMTPGTTLHQDESFSARTLVCEGPVARFCKALLVVDVASGPLDMTIVPHESVLLSLQLAEGPDPFARVADRGVLPHLCSWRSHLHAYVAKGGCRSFFALLSPEGAMTLTGGGGLPGTESPRNPMATVMDRRALVALEDLLASTSVPDQQLALLGGWLQERLTARVHVPLQAARAARVAATMFSEPTLNMERVAQAEGLSRRQLERDFRRWFNATPKQVSLLARGQAAARLGLKGAKPADIAHELGFADQAHLNRVIKKLFGVSPPKIASAGRNALGRAFRQASGGGVVYL
jgi:AraC-like DNA-binding protein